MKSKLINEVEHREPPPKLEDQWLHRLDFRINQLYALGTKLTHWEQNFIGDMKHKLNTGRISGLSNKQRQFILKIYHEYQNRNMVTIPEDRI